MLTEIEEERQVLIKPNQNMFEETKGCNSCESTCYYLYCSHFGYDECPLSQDDDMNVF